MCLVDQLYGKTYHIGNKVDSYGDIDYEEDCRNTMPTVGLHHHIRMADQEWRVWVGRPVGGMVGAPVRGMEGVWECERELGRVDVYDLILTLLLSRQ